MPAGRQMCVQSAESGARAPARSKLRAEVKIISPCAFSSASRHGSNGNQQGVWIRLDPAAAQMLALAMLWALLGAAAVPAARARLPENCQKTGWDVWWGVSGSSRGGARWWPARRQPA